MLQALNCEWLPPKPPALLQPPQARHYATEVPGGDRSLHETTGSLGARISDGEKSEGDWSRRGLFPIHLPLINPLPLPIASQPLIISPTIHIDPYYIHPRLP